MLFLLLSHPPAQVLAPAAWTGLEMPQLGTAVTRSCFGLTLSVKNQLRMS